LPRDQFRHSCPLESFSQTCRPSWSRDISFCVFFEYVHLSFSQLPSSISSTPSSLVAGELPNSTSSFLPICHDVPCVSDTPMPFAFYGSVLLAPPFPEQPKVVYKFDPFGDASALFFGSSTHSCLVFPSFRKFLGGVRQIPLLFSSPPPVPPPPASDAGQFR